MTPKERKEKRRQKTKTCMLNLLVVLCAIAGVILTDPWQAYRRGEPAVWIAPANMLEVIFSVVIGVAVIYTAQEHGRTDSVKAQKRIVNRCLMAFLAGAGVGAA